MIKRTFDILWSIIGIFLLSPVLILVALVIFLEDGSWPFFRQTRVGYMGVTFRIWKFRTMIVGDEQTGLAITVGRDPRITPIGWWLRKFKIDELPQLFNVIAGQMSLVGPRPEVEKYVSLYCADQREVLSLIPGITDLASIQYRSESMILANSIDPEYTYINVIMPEKIKINLSYAAKANCWNDFRVIISTIFPWVPTPD